MTEAVPFILLGLVLTIGYIVWRAGVRRREAAGRETSMEDLLREAEQEARAAAREQEDLLALPPEQEYEQQRIRRMAEQKDGEARQNENNPPDPSPDRPR